MLIDNFKLILIFGFILILSGCSPAAKQKMLRIFFDGVPPVQSELGDQKPEKQTLEDLKQVKAGAGVVEQERRLDKQETVSFYRHLPFAEAECDACHKREFSQSLVARGKELCFSCHDDFLAQAEVKHFPAEEGMCLECHNPHQSRNKYLLIRTGQSLCLECHDKGELINKEPHNEIGEEDCVSCHDPHKGREALLK